MTKLEVRALWKQRVAEFRVSGQTQAAWCREHGVTTRQMNYWLKVYKTAKPVDWVSVEVTGQPPAAASTEEPIIVAIGSARIELRSGFNRRLLKDIVSVLNGIC